MAPQVLLLRSKEPAIGPYPETDESSVHLSSLLFYDPFYVICSIVLYYVTMCMYVYPSSGHLISKPD
jgi:hypothetical protein